MCAAGGLETGSLYGKSTCLLEPTISIQCDSDEYACILIVAVSYLHRGLDTFWVERYRMAAVVVSRLVEGETLRDVSLETLYTPKSQVSMVP